MVLALAALENKDKDVDDIDLSDPDDLADLGIVIDGDPKKAQVTDPDDPVTTALAAYLNLIAADKTGKFDDDPLTSAIKDAFGL
jgi:hypothetical protein